MLTEFDVGVGVMLNDFEDDTYVYGVVLHNDGAGLEIVPVRGLDSDVKCYDEGGADYERDRDNVHLKCCPPPFSLLCGISERGGCYALAGFDDRIRLSESELMEYGAYVIDDAMRVSDSDLSEIIDHPWRDEKSLGLEPDWRSFAQNAREGTYESAPSRSSGAMARMRARMGLRESLCENQAHDDFNGPEF